MQQAAETGAKPRSQPRSGLGQQLLNLALASPLWEYVLVPQARASIVKTAEGKSLHDECEDIPVCQFTVIHRLIIVTYSIYIECHR